MREFEAMLKCVPDSYNDFIIAVLNYTNNEKRYNVVKEFMSDNLLATTSDILEFISEQGDFYDN